MTLSVGTRLGPYEIVGVLGVGGMGEVYRAHDSRLKRDVAIKTLPANLAGDGNRLARFQREAQVLASLSHPHIAALYGLEDSGGTLALVMELVEGSTLAERIAAGPIPVEEALAIARQVGGALEAAHEQGIVHRDLKPANVKVRPDGQVKVLDFGLAKFLECQPASGDPSESPTLTIASTRAGQIMGTAAYMSPEQARGKPVDKRADIWSFGVVFTEMLTGRRVFEGETVSDTLAAVLRAEPDWNRLPAGTPPGLRRLLQRCLERDPKNRLRDIGDAWSDTDRPAETAGTPRPHQGVLLRLAWITCGLFAIAGGFGWWGWLRSPPPHSHTVTRSAMITANYTRSPALSRDGSRLAYFELFDPPRLMLRMMDQVDGRAISGAGNAMRSPVFSPDGRWMAYITGHGEMMKIPVDGGTPITLCDGSDAFHLSWDDDDTIVIGSSSGLTRLSAAGGTPQALTATNTKTGESRHDYPQSLPGRQAILFTIGMGPSPEPARIAVLDLKTRAYRVLVNSGYAARYLPTGHLVYIRGTALFAVPFDVKRLTVTGSEMPVVEGVDSGQYTVSDSGLLVFPLNVEPEPVPSTLQRTDRKGAAQPLPEPPHEWGTLAVSPDGKRFACSIWDRTSRSDTHSDIWIYTVERGTLTRLTFEGSNLAPVWTPDGRWVTYGSTRAEKQGIYKVPVDGSGSPELLLAAKSDVYPSSWTPDGKALFYSQRARPGGGMCKSQIWILPVTGSGVESRPRLFFETLGNEYALRAAPLKVSPDGKWVAYQSDESGRYEVYVVPVSGPGGKSQISTQGGDTPKWSRSGRELYYVEPDSQRLMSAPVHPGPRFGVVQPLFKLTASYAAWDVMPDSDRFLVERLPDRPPAKYTMITVTDWFADLSRRVPAKP